LLKGLEKINHEMLKKAEVSEQLKTRERVQGQEIQDKYFQKGVLTARYINPQRLRLCMKSSQIPHNYVLVLEQNSDDLHRLEALFQRLSCSIVVTNSAEQAVARASQAPPYLIILSGSTWSTPLIHRFRDIADACDSPILALTDSHAPSWQRQEDNPGFDGFLVKPLHGDVLAGLVQSALARKNYCLAS
jgi:CheY-like chemotaxis protein